MDSSYPYIASLTREPFLFYEMRTVAKLMRDGLMSLQEIVVPVIEYRYLHNDSMEYKRNKQKYDTKPVTVSLLSASRKISNMIFSLNFYQKDAVGDNREAATYLVYVTNESGKQISAVQKIIADKTCDNGCD